MEKPPLSAGAISCKSLSSSKAAFCELASFSVQIRSALRKLTIDTASALLVESNWSRRSAFTIREAFCSSYNLRSLTNLSSWIGWMDGSPWGLEKRSSYHNQANQVIQRRVKKADDISICTYLAPYQFGYSPSPEVYGANIKNMS